MAHWFYKWFCPPLKFFCVFLLHLRYNLDFLPRPSLHLWHRFIPSYPSIFSIFLDVHLWMICAPFCLRAFAPAYLAIQDALLLLFTWLNSALSQHSASVSLHQEILLQHIHHPEKAAPPIINPSSTFSFEICFCISVITAARGGIGDWQILMNKSVNEWVCN